ncbi:type I restriction endonuclease subunit R [Neolewinella agarilytica]|uniref:type I restriction endonuclease subunit R n=1 Tax=Neolewinella agarilytica TaxID=478744 RepID=UPI002352D779|nr:type I restriction endonuclease subunit R [Neolewinella agarilytica]
MIPNWLEDHVSQLPALQLLLNVGYDYLPPAEADRLRGGRRSNVLLEPILRERLAALNSITRRGEVYAFSEANLDAAVLAVRELPLQEGPINANRHLYDLLTMGKTLEQRIDGDKKSHTLHYIDWVNVERNAFHVTEEFSVTRSGRSDSYRPDLVLFVNGIPLVVIECKSPALSGTTPPVDLAVEQHIRNFKRDGIRDLYVYSGLLLSLAVNAAKYGTTGTGKEFWSVWKEVTPALPTSPGTGGRARETLLDAEISHAKNTALTQVQKEVLYAERTHGFHYARRYFDALEDSVRPVTEQDKLLYGLCRPARLLDIVRNFTLYDDGIKKVARYQQYFAVNEAIVRVTARKPDGSRKGGVVWHTQGSGKSLTMVMLAQLLANHPEITNPRIILVTDRVDLDDQIADTFKKCKQERIQARTGKHLTELLEAGGDEIITTIVNKFEAAVKDIRQPFTDDNIFVLIDEGHRTQYGSFNVAMQRVFPRASFIAFTGTPLMKSEKSTAEKFGGYIGLPYTVKDAVADGAVVPLLYEGRHNHITLNEDPINRHFDRISEPLSDYGKAQLKRKFSTKEFINRADQLVYERAVDISDHYVKFFQTEGDKYKPKAQLVAPRVKTALLYKKYLDDIGKVTSEVVVTRGDQREGHEDAFHEQDEDKAFEDRYFEAMYDKYGDQKKFEENVINQFKKAEHPEILIVVAKLLTGFDAPKNTVLYLCRGLKEHTLLQAVARVNRVYPGKDYGYIIDYYGNLENLDSALETYSALKEYDAADIADALTNIREEVAKLPQAHAELWDIFKTLRGKTVEATVYEELLAPQDIRDKFYEKLSTYAKLLKMALSSVEFMDKTPESKIKTYKKDLTFFLKLRVDVKRRYNDELSYREYEPQIQKLVDKHIRVDGETLRITELVNVFDQGAREAELDKFSSDAARADHIASRTTKAINLKMDDDPIYYKKLADLIKEAIAAYHEKRISEAEFLKRVQDYENKFHHGRQDDAPAGLRGNESALAFYDHSRAIFTDEELLKTDFHVEVGLAVDEVVRAHIYRDGIKVVDWEKKSDVLKTIKLDLGDRVFDLFKKYRRDVAVEDINHLEAACLKVALSKYS